MFVYIYKNTERNLNPKPPPPNQVADVPLWVTSGMDGYVRLWSEPQPLTPTP